MVLEWCTGEDLFENLIRWGVDDSIGNGSFASRIVSQSSAGCLIVLVRVDQPVRVRNATLTFLTEQVPRMPRGSPDDPISARDAEQARLVPQGPEA